MHMLSLEFTMSKAFKFVVKETGALRKSICRESESSP